MSPRSGQMICPRPSSSTDSAERQPDGRLLTFVLGLDHVARVGEELHRRVLRLELERRADLRLELLEVGRLRRAHEALIAALHREARRLREHREEHAGRQLTLEAASAFLVDPRLRPEHDPRRAGGRRDQRHALPLATLLLRDRDDALADALQALFDLLLLGLELEPRFDEVLELHLVCGQVDVAAVDLDAFRSRCGHEGLLLLAPSDGGDEGLARGGVRAEDVHELVPLIEEEVVHRRRGRLHRREVAGHAHELDRAGVEELERFLEAAIAGVGARRGGVDDEHLLALEVGAAGDALADEPGVRLPRDVHGGLALLLEGAHEETELRVGGDRANAQELVLLGASEAEHLAAIEPDRDGDARRGVGARAGGGQGPLHLRSPFGRDERHLAEREELLLRRAGHVRALERLDAEVFAATAVIAKPRDHPPREVGRAGADEERGPPLGRRRHDEEIDLDAVAVARGRFVLVERVPKPLVLPAHRALLVRLEHALVEQVPERAIERRGRRDRLADEIELHVGGLRDADDLDVADHGPAAPYRAGDLDALTGVGEERDELRRDAEAPEERDARPGAHDATSRMIAIREPAIATRKMPSRTYNAARGRGAGQPRSKNAPRRRSPAPAPAATM